MPNAGNGKFLKVLGAIVIVLGIVFGLYVAFTLFKYQQTTGVVVVFASVLGSLISGGLLIGFGELVQNSALQTEHMRDIQETLTESLITQRALQTAYRTGNRPPNQGGPKAEKQTGSDQTTTIY